ncbi:MAG: hypothetical protein KF789_00810 [Bdellovibrionaceae bacterium]|nr:hypothetical protein [Pseudobdellovibrionaceae bacterium]
MKKMFLALLFTFTASASLAATPEIQEILCRPEGKQNAVFALRKVAWDKDIVFQVYLDLNGTGLKEVEGMTMLLTSVKSNALYFMEEARPNVSWFTLYRLNQAGLLGLQMGANQTLTQFRVTCQVK